MHGQKNIKFKIIFYKNEILKTNCVHAINSHGYNWPDHDQEHCYHHAPTVKPEAATAVVELLMMGVRTPETC
jgi:hypothetical protein